MTPDALPRQRSPGETPLPERPAGFRGYCDWCDAMPDDVRPKGSPRTVEYLGSVEWAWSPAHDRYDAYYIGLRGRHWCLWRRWQDWDSPGQPWRWQLFGWARKGSESWEAAAVYTLLDAWGSDDALCGTGRFHWVAEPGHFSAVGINALADRVWPPTEKLEDRDASR